MKAKESRNGIFTEGNHQLTFLSSLTSVLAPLIPANLSKVKKIPLFSLCMKKKILHSKLHISFSSLNFFFAEPELGL